MEVLATWRPFQLNYIALWICDIDGRALSLGAIARANGPNLNAMRLQMPADAWLVEWLYPKAKVIKIAPLVSGRCTANSAELSVDGYQIDKGAAGAQLN
jgi:hypothetical protein